MLSHLAHPTYSSELHFEFELANRIKPGACPSCTHRVKFEPRHATGQALQLMAQARGKRRQRCALDILMTNQ